LSWISKNFQKLPEYGNEADARTVIMVMFTLGKYTNRNRGEMLSFNVQAAVALHDPVPEDERPAGTIIEAKDPLPII
jgi:hypothetical protein